MMLFVLAGIVVVRRLGVRTSEGLVCMDLVAVLGLREAQGSRSPCRGSGCGGVSCPIQNDGWSRERAI